jgi:hypothetical protein
MNTTPTESAVRRKANRRGYTLTKLGENSRWFREYGPIMLSDENRYIQHAHLNLDEANAILNDMQPLRLPKWNRG